MNTIIPAPTQPSLGVTGSDLRFPVRRIFCIGRNYAEHAREMGHDPEKSPPFFFEKHPSCLVTGDADAVLDFPYPSASQDVHHEIELVVALKSGGTNLDSDAARACVFGYAVGIDFTRRDLQAEAKKHGRPWTTAKSFDHSAPMSALTQAQDVENLAGLNIWLNKNDQRVQKGTLDEMIWGVEASISYLSTLFELFPGDIIMTGTPAGVGPVLKGDRLFGGIDKIGTIDVRCI
ncbi:MAG: fumarylacetoacetate hydrolase family protein [Ahrensia sp.]|nr:fumarylacetoacetate hydrolase family protein [Ahrensia sp.]